MALTRSLVAMSCASAAAFSAPHVGVHSALVARAARPAAPLMAEKVDTGMDTGVVEPELSFRGAVFADHPSDDPSEACFLAHDWMDSTDDEKWVCCSYSDLLQCDEAPAHPDDSY